jgi:hypothetical protein
VRVHTDKGTLAVLPCSAVAPTLGVDVAVPDTQAEPRLFLGRGRPLLCSLLALSMMVGTLDSFTAGKTPFAGRPFEANRRAPLGQV